MQPFIKVTFPKKEFLEAFNQAKKAKNLINGFIAYLKGKKKDSLPCIVAVQEL